LSLAVFVRRVIEVLDGAEVPYMLTGSLASAFYATPRATRDVDVVIDADRNVLARVVSCFAEAGFYVELDAAMEALESQGQFNAIDATVGWKVDLIIRKDRAFSREEFERRGQASLFGVEISLASPEDVLIAKLEWSKLGDSDLQRRDVAELLERAGSGLDLVYVEHWVSELGLSAEWRDAKRRASDDAVPDDVS
jgi:hypothetical protein